MYYGKMGWTWTELYTLPVWARRYYYTKLASIRKKENEAETTAYNKAKSGNR